MTKDYLTPLEAADYACVPLADFEALADGAGILSFPFMGATVYRKADIQCAMERAWRLSTGGAVALPSTGSRSRLGRRAGVGKVSDLYPKPKPMGWRSAEAMKKSSASWIPAVSKPPMEPINTRSPRYEHHLNELERIRRENEMGAE